MTTELKGQIERITFTSEENGYTVARVDVEGKPLPVTVVGTIMNPMVGDVMEMKGEWIKHPKYGQQFKLHSYETVMPASAEGIEKYLGSGLVKGLGPVMAERIVGTFGEETLDVIETDIERLTEVEGIGKRRIAMIKGAWDDQKEVRKVMMFLQSHGVSASLAVKIYKHYGNSSLLTIQENPYRLAYDIWGIGFLTADKIAEKLGFSKESPMRLQSGILYVLNELTGEGHVYYPRDKLMEKCLTMLGIQKVELLDSAINVLEGDKRIVVEDVVSTTRDEGPVTTGVYLSRFYTGECGIADGIARINRSEKVAVDLNIDELLDEVQKELHIDLAEMQETAVQSALKSKVLVITGGPGTGKTTIIKTIIEIYKRAPVTIKLAAPTGRAAKRMNEASGMPAKTIHRLLEYSLQQGGFQKDENNPLECDLLIIDEASMIDTLLMNSLLRAIPDRTTLVLVGDVNQLPSVGAGNVLNDIINSRAVPVVELDQIFRQARESKIIVNAHNINRGIIPDVDNDSKDSDFYFIKKDEPGDVLKAIRELVKIRIPRRFGFDAVQDIQVLTPMNKGQIGTINLNSELQQMLNPREDGITRGGTSYRVNDKVMQVKNNYEKDVYNGDIGRIVKIDLEEQDVAISFDSRVVDYDFTDLDEVVPAYAVSVHKSQGSEYPAVVIPVMTQHYIMLQRNLIYTAITRGKKLVVLVGTKKALAMAVKNDKTEKRFTNLCWRLNPSLQLNISQDTH